MRTTSRCTPNRIAALALLLALAAPAAAFAQLPDCISEDDIAGGLALPPTCKYLSPDDVHKVTDPAKQAEILARPIHQFFVCRKNGTAAPGGDCRTAGGSLGGDVEVFNSELVFELTGTGSLTGFHRTITIPNVAVEVHSSAQKPGAAEQDVATEMVRIQGSLPPGDPDFARFTIVGGTFNGHPSPGRTVGTWLGEGWRVKSYFDVGYTIEFVGASGSQLEGYRGVNPGVTRMVAAGQ